MYELSKLLKDSVERVLPALKTDVPIHLEDSIAELQKYSFSEIPIAVMKRAVSDGEFPDSDAAPPMILVIDEADGVIR